MYGKICTTASRDSFQRGTAMDQPNQPKPWQFHPKEPYLPVTYEGKVVGLCKPEYAMRMLEVLNDEEKVRKALLLACLDLMRQSNGDPNEAEQLVKKYLAKAERPKYGTRAIAAMLHDRQEQLDISDDEFAKFCDSYKLSRKELQGIYAGLKIGDIQLGPLSRILGRSAEDLMAVRDGGSK